MLKKYLPFFCFVFCVFVANAQTVDDLKNNPNFRTTEEILALAHDEHPTNCASTAFSNALLKHSSEIDESEPEFKVRAWARETMTGDTEILTEILQCPELQNIADDTTIIFNPIVYEFPMGRTITINYSTQPKILKQKLLMATKRSLPNGDASPKLMDPNDPAKYMSTEPAWYAIMVVQHDSLKDFVGPGRNNTLSVKYINDNIDNIYPQGYYCTSKSAWANDTDTINKVVHDVVNIEKDTNDYYVAGDVNLEWVMYAEVAADVIITILTMGGGEVLMAATKESRATKLSEDLVKSMKDLSKLDDVKQYRDVAKQIATHTDDITKIEKEIQSAKNAEEILKHKDDIKKLQESIKTLETTADNMAKASKNVAQFKEQADAFREVWKYRQALKAWRAPQTGNIVVRSLKKIGAIGKSLHAANGGAKAMTKAGKIVRAGMSSRSAKMKHWLIDAGLKHGARLAKFERNAGFLYGAISFLGDMYDYTSSTSKEFSNGIEFKPLCLLSADDLAGQDNVVNYGMWLMWVGDSTDESSDDAAYLQAMDFASKFYYQLDEFQDEHGANCNVDIYVVRPIIRLDETNVNDPKGEMFYLFMNEIPWSTAEQFGELVPNIEDWKRTQSELTKQDPNNKYKKETPEQVAAQETTELYAPENAE